MLSLSELIQATEARVAGDGSERRLVGFAYDSRADCRGRAFVALRTETGDGHDYIAAAVAAGAAAVLCERPPDTPVDVPLLLVPDALAALAAWATAAVRRWQPRIVAVTGGLGKTTTKELATAVLGRRFRAVASPGNLSGRLGLPVALAEMDRTAEVAVLEFAADAYGELAALAAMAPPDLLVVTNVCEPHQDVFGSLDAAAAEMAQVLDRMAPEGVAVLNRADPRVWALRARARGRALSFCEAGADVSAGQVRQGREGLRFAITAEGRALPAAACLHSPALVADCLAAVAAGLALGVPLDEAAAALAGVDPVPGRLSPVPAQGGATILDDTFSACPTSALTALTGLAGHPGNKRLLVLGGLDDTAACADWAGDLARAARAADMVWALGDAAAEVVRRLPAERSGGVFYSLPELAQAVAAQLDGDDVLLVKGNRSSRLERLVAELAEPGARGRLVRQESHWQSVRLARPERPTWVEIDVEALAQNTRLIRQAVAVPLMAVLKADAYGHGAVRVARVVMANGADSLAVACLSEAKVLRQAGIEAPVLVLGYTPPWQARDCVRSRVAATVFGIEDAEALSRAAQALGAAIAVHVKVDTGMARLGLTPEETPPFLAALAHLRGLTVEGVFTHFGSADSPGLPYTDLQLERFLALLAALERQGLRPPVAHAANTAAALTLPAARLDAVRVGIGLYGRRPSAAVSLPSGCRPVLSFKTTVGQVRSVPVGTYVGYGQGHRTSEVRRIATIPVGYADGFRRGPSNWGEVLIRGRRCPIIGSVCMDQAMVDVSEATDVAKGDEVVLIGRQGDFGISAEEVAAHLGTISYEVVSAILPRVPRTV